MTVSRATPIHKTTIHYWSFSSHNNKFKLLITSVKLFLQISILFLSSSFSTLFQNLYNLSHCPISLSTKSLFLHDIFILYNLSTYSFNLSLSFYQKRATSTLHRCVHTYCCIYLESGKKWDWTWKFEKKLLKFTPMNPVENKANYELEKSWELLIRLAEHKRTVYVPTFQPGTRRKNFNRTNRPANLSNKSSKKFNPFYPDYYTSTSPSSSLLKQNYTLIIFNLPKVSKIRTSF